MGHGSVAPLFAGHQCGKLWMRCGSAGMNRVLAHHLVMTLTDLFVGQLEEAALESLGFEVHRSDRGGQAGQCF